VKKSKLNAELANGRLAMMAIIGMFFQDGVVLSVLHVCCMLFACSLHDLCMFFACPLHDLCMFFACPLHVLCCCHCPFDISKQSPAF
jgi:hypothetical protein